MKKNTLKLLDFATLTFSIMIFLLGVLLNTRFFEWYLRHELSEQTILKIHILQSMVISLSIILFMLVFLELKNKIMFIEWIYLNKKKITLLIATIILFFLFMEFTLRALYPISPQIDRDYIPRFFFEKHDILGYKMSDNFEGYMKADEYNSYIKINSEGLRDREISGEKNKILVLGDSFAFGWGVSNGETFSDFIENKENMEVINAGVGGYGTDQELLYLKNYGVKYKPKAVILTIFVGNDLSDNVNATNLTVVDGFFLRNFREEERRKSHVYLFFSGRINNIFKKYNNKSGYDELFDKREFYEVLAGRTQQENNEWETTLSLIEEMYDYTQENDIKLIIVNVPPKKFFPLDKEAYSIIKSRSRLHEFTERRKIKFIDLAEEFGSEDRPENFYYKIDGHFNKLGHEKVAEIMRKELKNEGII